MELGYSGLWRGEGQVETCRADGPGAVKDGRAVRRTCHADVPRAVKGGREAWTDGLEAGGSAVVAGSLRQRQAEKCDHVGGRGAQAVHPLYDAGLLVEPGKNQRWTVSRFGPQNLGAGYPG